MEKLAGIWYDGGRSPRAHGKIEQEEQQMEKLSKEELQQASGGVYEDTPHCPKCQGKDLVLIGPGDIGTPPCYRCQACGYEWMLAL